MDLLTTVRDKNHLSQLIDAGVKGFKCFLIESGVDVSDILCMTIITSVDQEFPCVGEQDVDLAMQALQVNGLSVKSL